MISEWWLLILNHEDPKEALRDTKGDFGLMISEWWFGFLNHKDSKEALSNTKWISEWWFQNDDLGINPIIHSTFQPFNQPQANDEWWIGNDELEENTHQNPVIMNHKFRMCIGIPEPETCNLKPEEIDDFWLMIFIFNSIYPINSFIQPQANDEWWIGNDELEENTHQNPVIMNLKLVTWNLKRMMIFESTLSTNQPVNQPPTTQTIRQSNENHT